MENRLKDLFDFQRFEKNAKLADLIAQSENRYAASLSDESLAQVNAAGTVETMFLHNPGSGRESACIPRSAENASDPSCKDPEI